MTNITPLQFDPPHRDPEQRRSHLRGVPDSTAPRYDGVGTERAATVRIERVPPPPIASASDSGGARPTAATNVAAAVDVRPVNAVPAQPAAPAIPTTVVNGGGLDTAIGRALGLLPGTTTTPA